MNRDITGNSLAAFAYVYDSYKSTGDVGIGLANLFRPIIAVFQGKVFDPNEISARFQEVYGLEVFPIAVEGLLHHFQRLRLVRLMTAEESSGDSYYLCTADPIDDQDSKHAEYFEDMMNQFVDYAQKSLSTANLDEINAEVLRKEFLARLTQIQFLEAAEQEEKDHFVGDTLSLSKEEYDEPPNIEKVLDVISAKFLMDLFEQNGSEIDQLISVMNGALLSEVLLTLQLHEDFDELSSLTIVLDSPLILDSMSLSGKENQVYAEHLFSLIDSSGAKKVTYLHCLEEARNVLSTVLDRVGRGDYIHGPLGKMFALDAGAIASARLSYSHFDENVESIGVQVIDAPNIKEYPHLEQYFPEEEKDRLRNSLGELHFDVDRRERDAESIAAVIRNRGTNKDPRTIADASYLFITRNVKLQRLSTKQLLHRNILPSGAVPACISDRQLAGVLWLTVGGELSELNKEKLVSRCIEVLDPNTNLVSKVLQVLHEHEGAEERIREFQALMLDERARNCLVVETLGWTSLVDDRSIRQLIDRIKQATAEKERQIAERKILEITGDFERSRKGLEAGISRRDTKISIQRTDKKKAEKSQAGRKKHRKKMYKRSAQVISYGIYVALVILAYWFNTFLERFWFLSFVLFELVVALIGEKYFRPMLMKWLYTKFKEILEA